MYTTPNRGYRAPEPGDYVIQSLDALKETISKLDTDVASLRQQSVDGGITVKEQDGLPTVMNVKELRVPSGALHDDGNGAVSFVLGGGLGGESVIFEKGPADFVLDVLLNLYYIDCAHGLERAVVLCQVFDAENNQILPAKTQCINPLVVRVFFTDVPNQTIRAVVCSGITKTIKDNNFSNRLPEGYDDAVVGYTWGSLWIFGERIFICTAPTVGSAVWTELVSMRQVRKAAIIFG
ncbi:MAG: hypothetical protein NTU61_06480 [Candidatus Altiarchaeota archaeon]|nr:hypothetical protein [Candidatus Altiarchaeota archaeon]